MNVVDVAALDAAGQMAGPYLERRVRARRRGPRAAKSWADAVQAREVAVGDHAHWAGPVSAHGTPVVSLRGVTRSVYRVVFADAHGRPPAGLVRPVRGYPTCVAGGHLTDAALRAGGARDGR